MRSSVILSAAILASASFIVPGCQTAAETAPGPDPDTYPVLRSDPPPRLPPVAVMVLPFRLVGNMTDGAWISEAIEGDLRVELLKNAAVTLIPQPDVLPKNEPDAIQAGRAAGAKYVVYGTYQYINDQLRVTGAIFNTADGSVLTPLSATGNMSDLFKMEDGLVAQVQEVMPAPQPVVAQAAAAEPDVYYPNYPPYMATPQEEYPPDYEYSPDIYPDFPFLVAGGFYGGIGYGGGFYGGRRGGFSGGRGFTSSRAGAFRGNAFGGGIHANTFGGGVHSAFGAGGSHGGGFAGGGRR